MTPDFTNLTPEIRACLLRQTVAQLKGLRRTVAIPEPSSGGFVYFIAGASGAVKIGYARDLRKRLAALQTGSPVPLQVLATVPGGSRLEREYHRRFADHALHGEWFRDCRAIREEVNRLRREARAMRRDQRKLAA